MMEQVKSGKKRGEKTDILFSMPKNLRQIGQAGEDREIYIEDYVLSYVRYLGKEATSEYKIAVFLGETREWEGKTCIFIHGAMEVDDIDINQCSCFPKEIWEGIYQLIEEYFKEGSIVGWMVTKAGILLEPSEWLEKIHIDNFAGREKTLMIYDTLEREEAFFLFDEAHLKRTPGYVIYYEKNQEMQNYMLTKKGEVQKEEVDDTVIVEMRKKMEKMEEKKKKAGKGRRLFQGASVVGVLFLAGILSQQKLVQDTMIQMVSVLSEGKTEEENKNMLEQKEAKITISKEKVVGDETDKPSKKNEKKEKEKAVSVSQSKVESKERYYTIQPGDTLVSICMEQFQSLENMEEIMEINHITDKNKIVAGQKIKLWEE